MRHPLPIGLGLGTTFALWMAYVDAPIEKLIRDRDTKAWIAFAQADARLRPLWLEYQAELAAIESKLRSGSLSSDEAENRRENAARAILAAIQIQGNYRTSLGLGIEVLHDLDPKADVVAKFSEKFVDFKMHGKKTDFDVFLEASENLFDEELGYLEGRHQDPALKDVYRLSVKGQAKVNSEQFKELIKIRLRTLLMQDQIDAWATHPGIKQPEFLQRLDFSDTLRATKSLSAEVRAHVLKNVAKWRAKFDEFAIVGIEPLSQDGDVVTAEMIRHQLIDQVLK